MKPEFHKMVGTDVHKQTPESVILQVTANKPRQGHHTLTHYLVEARSMLAKTKGAYPESANAQLYGMGLSPNIKEECVTDVYIKMWPNLEEVGAFAHGKE